MKTIRVSLFMLTALTMFSLLSVSCGSKKDSLTGASGILKKVPENAAAIAVINVGQMMKKLNYADFKKTEMFQDMLKEAKTDELKKILENPESSGIDLGSQFCMYLDAKGKDDYSMVFLLPVKNVKDLEAVFEKAAKAGDETPFKNIQSAKSYKFVKGKDATLNFALGWDKNLMVFIYNTKSDVEKSLSAVFENKGDKNISSNKNFKVDKIAKHDMVLWVQSDPFVSLVKEDKKMARSLKQITFLGLTEEALNGNTMAMYYDFNNGEMQAGISYKMNEQIEKEYGMIFKKKMDTDFSAYFPKKNLTSISMFGLDMNGLKKVMENRSVDGFANAYLSNMGIKLDEILKGFNGEFAFASYIDPNSKDPLTNQKVVVAIALNNSEILNKLMKASRELGVGEIKKSGNRYSSAMTKEVQGILKNNVFVISNDLSVIDKIENGGFKGDAAIESKHYAEMKKGWASGHVDYTQLISSLQNLPLNTPDALRMSEIFTILREYNELTSSTAVVNTEEAKVILSMKNKDKNSLKVFSELLNRAYLNREKIQQKLDEIDTETKKGENI
jgi:hypothetical protein